MSILPIYLAYLSRIQARFYLIPILLAARNSATSLSFIPSKQQFKWSHSEIKKPNRLTCSVYGLILGYEVINDNFAR